jgi:hypothetical protein
MNWFIPRRSLRGAFIRRIGEGEVDRDLPGYLRDRLEDVEVDETFKGATCSWPRESGVETRHPSAPAR